MTQANELLTMTMTTEIVMELDLDIIEIDIDFDEDNLDDLDDSVLIEPDGKKPRKVTASRRRARKSPIPKTPFGFIYRKLAAYDYCEPKKKLNLLVKLLTSSI
jgi:hypothetical protein